MTPLAFPLGPIELIMLTIITIPVIAGVVVLIVFLTRRRPTPQPRQNAPTPGQPPR